MRLVVGFGCDACGDACGDAVAGGSGGVAVCTEGVARADTAPLEDAALLVAP